MSKVRVLDQATVARLMTVGGAIEAVEKAYLQKASGEGSLWPMVFHEFDPGHADLDIKSGDLGGSGVFGFKLVSWYGANPEKGLPELFGTSMLFDIKTGAPVALLNASALTGLRTGAAAAIGAKYLARKDSEVLTMAGCGMLAPYAIAATLKECPSVKKVFLANPRSPEKAAAVLAKVQARVEELLSQSGCQTAFELTAADSLEQAVRQSDIVITGTPARSPILKAEWIKPGTHISCLGADMTGKQEAESALVAKALLVVDDKDQSLRVGESEVAVADGAITADHIVGELGAVMNGSLAGRTDDGQITLFDSTGIALQDLACCAVVLAKAEEQGLGVVVDL